MKTKILTQKNLVLAAYGEKQGKAVRCAEAFELCEYGRRPSGAELEKLFPFFES